MFLPFGVSIAMLLLAPVSVWGGDAATSAVAATAMTVVAVAGWILYVYVVAVVQYGTHP